MQSVWIYCNCYIIKTVPMTNSYNTMDQYYTIAEDRDVHSSQPIHLFLFSAKSLMSTDCLLSMIDFCATGHFYNSPINGANLQIPPDVRPRRMRALFDYDPRELSPNLDVDSELPFNQGDVLMIYGEMDDDGFFLVSI